MEPQVPEADRCVPRPLKATSGTSTNLVLRTHEQMLSLAVARFFHPDNFSGDGVEFQTVRNAIFSDYTKETSWSLERSSLRKKLNVLLTLIAFEFDEEKNGIVITKYRPRERRTNEHGQDLSAQYSVDELCKSFTPEDVCIYESSLAAEFRLRELGIGEALQTQDVEKFLYRMMALRAFREDRAVQAQYLLALEIKRSGTGSPESKALQSLARYLISEILVVEKRLRVGRFVLRKLLVAPWNTTSTFFNSHVQPDGLGKMALTNELGDPSGRGEGFAFIRLLEERPDFNKATKRAIVTPVGAVHNTNRDLRKINDEDAIRLCVSFGLDAVESRKLKRWDRIALIRGYATKAIEDGTTLTMDPTMTEMLMRFARGGAIQATVQENKQSFREMCVELWGRQLEALSSSLPPHGASDADDYDDDAVEDEDEDDDIEDEDDEAAAEKAVCTLIVDRAASLGLRKNEEAAKTEKAKISREEEQKELNSMRSFFSGRGEGSSSGNVVGSAAPAPPQIRVDSSSIPSRTSTGSLPSSSNDVRQQFPARVVRRTIRVVHEDGTESVTFQFIASERDIGRVQQALRKSARTQDYARNYAARDRTKQLLKGADDALVQELRAPVTGARSFKAPSMKIKVDLARANAAVNRQAKEEAGGPIYPKSTSTSRGVGFPFYRLPHVSFAALLEKAIMSLYSPKASLEFRQLWNPVNPKTLPRYFDIIKRPISLSEIRENIGAWPGLFFPFAKAATLFLLRPLSPLSSLLSSPLLSPPCDGSVLQVRFLSALSQRHRAARQQLAHLQWLREPHHQESRGDQGELKENPRARIQDSGPRALPPAQLRTLHPPKVSKN
jgi:hypothetical protein